MEEVLDVVKSLNSWRTPGLDGFNAQFYKSSWHLISTDPFSLVEGFFRNELE